MWVPNSHVILWTILLPNFNLEAAAKSSSTPLWQSTPWINRASTWTSRGTGTTSITENSGTRGGPIWPPPAPPIYISTPLRMVATTRLSFEATETYIPSRTIFIWGTSVITPTVLTSGPSVCFFYFFLSHIPLQRAQGPPFLGIMPWQGANSSPGSRPKTSYKRRTKKNTKPALIGPNVSTSTKAETRQGKPSLPLRSTVARPPTPLILFHHMLPTPYLHVYAFGSRNCPLEKENQWTECLPPPHMLLKKPPHTNNSSTLPLKYSFHLLYMCLKGSMTGNSMHHIGPCQLANCSRRLHRFGHGSNTRRLFLRSRSIW